MWALFFAGLGLAMFIEGMPYFVSPRGTRRYLELVRRMNDFSLRTAGLLLMICGLIVVYVATR